MIKRRLIWCLINGSMSGLMIAGISFGVHGAKNVFVFFTVAACILSTLANVSEETKKAHFERGRTIPVVLDVTYDVITIGYLAWNGLTGIAVIYLILAVMNNALHVETKAVKL